MNENFHHQHQADSTSKPPAVFSQQSYLSHSIKRNEAPLPVPGESNHFESNSTSHAYKEETIHKVYLHSKLLYISYLEICQCIILFLGKIISINKSNTIRTEKLVPLLFRF
jgi:hypothetical protein